MTVAVYCLPTLDIVGSKCRNILEVESNLSAVHCLRSHPGKVFVSVQSQVCRSRQSNLCRIDLHLSTAVVVFILIAVVHHLSAVNIFLLCSSNIEREAECSLLANAESLGRLLLVDSLTVEIEEHRVVVGNLCTLVGYSNVDCCLIANRRIVRLRNGSQSEVVASSLLDSPVVGEYTSAWSRQVSLESHLSFLTLQSR